MGQHPLAAAIAGVREEFAVSIADTAELRQEAFRLRHQVYCIERGFEASLSDIETDAFDDQSCHVLLRHRAGGDVLGTVRIVLSRRARAPAQFPLQTVCAPGLLDKLPLAATGEISRFAISKDRRVTAGSTSALMRLGLIQGLVTASGRLRLTHWCAVMERSLLRLLQTTGIHFEPIGPLIEYHGIRQPAWCRLDAMLARMRREQPLIWELIVEDSVWADSSDASPLHHGRARVARG
ncbi:MAG: PEP-CTERM/exosortase system-associated acyltransferase [Acetobacteraceae bacterium]|nr:PEP-CTERM/exosortase system-associated acyltransferase [Acetobacteraceae bacterium]